MDTIDISNLNRQFLFRRRHVGQPKSVVARESALLYTQDASECHIVAHHDDVKTLQYGPEFVKEFDIVLNALDNLSARRHVGRVCWSANVPYVESGTAGWYGQVQPFIPGKTGCFECDVRPPPTTFPVCTIRSNPSKPIHTIMWAKHLFNCLFGKADEENAVTDLSSTNNTVSSSENAKSDTEISEELKARLAQDSIALAQKKASGDFADFVFHKVFCSDILNVSTMTNLWTDRAPPKPYILKELLEDAAFAVIPQSNNIASANSHTLEDQKLWSLKHCAEIFLSCCVKLKALAEASGENGLSWDKDEPLHLDFVVAASNLRSSQYAIPIQSKFAVKSDAGNIIPAIATTNAIIAGLIVVEAIKILTEKTDQCRSVFLVQKSRRRSMLMNEEKPYKNPSCYVCSNQFLHIKVDTHKVTLKTFVEDILTKQLGVLEPSIIVGDDIIYESDGEFDHQLTKSFHDVRIRHSAVVHVESFEYDFKLEVSIEHAPAITFAEPTKPFQVVGSVSAPASTAPVTVDSKQASTSATSESDATSSKPQNGDNSAVVDLDADDDIEIIDEPTPTVATTSSKKRSHDEIAVIDDDDDIQVTEPPTKKSC